MKNLPGIIILAISLIISAWIIAYQIGKSRQSYPGTVQTFPRQIDLNNNLETDFYSEMKVGDGEKLYIISKHNAAPIIIEGNDIITKYHHVAKMLGVEYTKDSVKSIKYFTDVLEWGNKPK